MFRRLRVSLALIAIIPAAALLIACGGGGGNTPTPRATSTPKPAATATTGAVPLPPTETPVAATATPAPVVDPCTLFNSLEGQPLTPGPTFALNIDVKWQMCDGGAAAGSFEKYLFRTDDAGASWKLISETTLGNPTPQPGVGQLPNAGAAVQIRFVDETHGWLGLNGPGENLWRSQDGGVTWSAIDAIPPAVPVTSITFTDPQHGTVVTPEGDYTTNDGGVTWTKTS
jgi:hypothetical protein